MTLINSFNDSCHKLMSIFIIEINSKTDSCQYLKIKFGLNRQKKRTYFNSLLVTTSAALTIEIAITLRYLGFNSRLSKMGLFCKPRFNHLLFYFFQIQ